MRDETREELKDIAKLMLAAVAIVAVVGFVAFYGVRESWEDRGARIQAEREAWEARRAELAEVRVYIWDFWGRQSKMVAPGYYRDFEGFKGWERRTDSPSPPDFSYVHNKRGRERMQRDIRLKMVRDGLGRIIEDYREEIERGYHLVRGGGKVRKMVTVR